MIKRNACPIHLIDIWRQMPKENLDAFALANVRVNPIIVVDKIMIFSYSIANGANSLNHDVETNDVNLTPLA